MLLGKIIKKLFITPNEKVTQNIFVLPVIMIFLQFCFLFVALFNSHYFFEKQVLLLTIFLLSLWSWFAISFAKKEKLSLISKKNIILYLCFIYFCLTILCQNWFGNYARIDAIKVFFDGKTFIDPLYHSVHAESIVINGYPSMLMNTAAFHAYHCGSHYIIAGFAKVLNIPSLVIYNYIYPIVFFPLFLFLLQKMIIIGKSYLLEKETNLIYFIDYLLLLSCVYGFFSNAFQKKIGFTFSFGVFSSESNHIALVFIFLFFYIVDFGSRKIKRFDYVTYYFLIPLFILILLYTKISAGFMFLLGACYYVFRKYFGNSKRCLLFILYIGIFFLYYWILTKFSESFPSCEVRQRNSVNFFDYVRTFCNKKSIFFPVFHYAFLFSPSLLVIFLNKKNIFVKNFIYNNKTIFEEMSFLLMLAAILPGALIKINGGSAFYFIFPVYFFTWLLFISLEIPKRLSCFYFVIVKNNVLYKKSILFIALLFCFFNYCHQDLNFYEMVIITLRSRQSLVGFRTDLANNIRKLYGPAQTIEKTNYLLFNSIRKKISKSPQDYCIFSENFELIEQFDRAYYIPRLQAYLARPYWAMGGYLGLPVINSIYVDGDCFYRGDGRKFGKYEEIHRYSLPPPVCGRKVTQENMIEYAKNIKKKYIIVLNNNSYSIVTVK